MLFPDGRLPSPRWRPLAWLCATAIILSLVGILIAPFSLGDMGHPEIANPLGIQALRPVRNVVFVPIALIPISMVGCAAALIQRFRRSHGQERLQLKWLALGAGATASLYLVLAVASFAKGSTSEGSDPGWLVVLRFVAVYASALIPVSIGIATLKHRLYDIDVIVNRALVYGALTATLGLSYLGGVVLLQQLLRPFTSGSEVAIAGSTLAAAALFRPLRRRIQAGVDRRFYRRRYHAAETLERFSARLRDELDIDSLQAELCDVVGATMAPAHVSLWLRGGRGRS